MKPLSDLLSKYPQKPARLHIAGATEPERASEIKLGKADCPLCGGMGIVKYNVPPSDERFGKIFDCECRASNPDHLAELWRAAGYPDSVRDLWQTWSLERLRGDASKAEAYRAANSLAASRSGLLLLHGVYSMGKTGVLVSLCNVFIRAGLSARWIRAQDLLDQISATYSANATTTVEDVQARYARFAFLAVDEIEKTSGSDHAKAALFRMLDERYNRRARQATALATNNLELLRQDQGYIVARWTDGWMVEMTGAPLRGPDAAKRGLNGRARGG